MKKNVFVLFLIFLISPVFIFGNNLNSYEIEYTDQGGATTEHIIEYEGIVPCGRCLSIRDLNPNDPLPIVNHELNRLNACDDAERETYIPCTLCHLFVVFDNIIAFFLLQLIPALAILIITFSGLMMIVSSGNPQKTTKAKNTLLYAAIGLLISLTAWIIITALLAFFMNWEINWWTDGGIQVQHTCRIQIEQFILD